jgi:YggT family protein
VGAAFVTTFVRFLALALWLLIMGRVLVSWVDPVGRTRVGAFLINATEPILAPVRRLMPRTGMIDFSPLVVLIVLGFIVRVLLGA